jgi:hypothetical protein
MLFTRLVIPVGHLVLERRQPAKKDVLLTPAPAKV